MKRAIKRYWMFTVLCILLAIRMPAEAFAGEQIRYVRLEMGYTAYVADADPYSIDISSYQDGFRIDFETKDIEAYEMGDEVRIDVNLMAKEGYSFTDIKKGSCRMDDTEPDSIRVSDDGKQLGMKFTMPPLKYRLDAPKGLKLSIQGEAEWISVNGADRYEVTVQKMSDMGQRDYVDSFETDENRASLYRYMYSDPGDYLYTVTARSNKKCAMDSKEAELEMSKSVLLTGEDIGYPLETLDDEGYAQLGYENCAKDAELKIGGKHYYFGSDGKRVSGWVKVNGKWHYFMPDTFERASGRTEDNGKEYHLDEETGDIMTGFVMEDGKERFYGSSGEAATGWVRYKGNIYYVNRDGTRNRNQLIDENGRTYLFDDEGRLIR